MLRIARSDIVFQEVPGEVSLSLSVAGCPLRCPGCHSAETWHPLRGKELTPQLLDEWLLKYRKLITCVLFFGGEWQEEALLTALRQVRTHNLKTCLYTGLDHVSHALMAELTYLKTGPWIAAYGGLDNPNTNQRFIDCQSGQCLNHYFRNENAAALA